MLNIPNLTKNVFKSRILEAIEAVVGNPIKYKREAIANKAMVKLIHGDAPDGNEHNVDKFFSEDEDSQPTVKWVLSDSYHFDSDYGDLQGITTNEFPTKEEAIYNLHTGVIDNLKESASYVVNNAHIVSETLKHLSRDEVEALVDDIELDIESPDSAEPHQVEEYIGHISHHTNELALKDMFLYLTNLTEVKGSYTLNEVEVQPCTPVPSVIEKEETPLTSAHIVMLKTFGFNEQGTGYVLEDTDQVVCLSSEAIEQAQREFFSTAFPDHDGVAENVLESSLVENWLDKTYESDFNATPEEEFDLQKEREKFEEDFNELGASDVCEWLLDNIDIDELVGDFLSDLLSGGLYAIEVSFVDVKA
ncbi:hypothetical protein VCHA53O466_140020 [Vibrio chagasii]|nr:hypothetical protein VCHA53O466_140020 [Vibrio chagasii]